MIAPRLSIPDSSPNPTEVFMAVRDFFSGFPLEQDLCAEDLAARLFVCGYLNTPPPLVDVQSAQEILLGAEAAV